MVKILLRKFAKEGFLELGDKEALDSMNINSIDDESKNSLNEIDNFRQVDNDYRNFMNNKRDLEKDKEEKERFIN